MTRVRQFCHDMGYRFDNLILAGIHSNTDNVHVHIFVSRLSSYDAGKPPVRENGGWTHNGIMQFLARESVREPDICALEPSVANFYRPVIVDGKPVTETITETDPIDGERISYERIVIKKMPTQPDTPKSLGPGADEMESHKGVKSHKRRLQEIVKDVLI